MSGGGTGWAVVNGRLAPLAEAALAITDDGAVRGDGAFEAVGVWGGGPFRLADHLARLAASLTAIGLPAADTELLAAQAWGLLESLGPRDAVLRFYVTASATSVVVLADQPIRVPPRRLVPQPAPWIRPLGSYPAAGAKTMSYGPNMAATRAAVRAGGDDALLYSLEGYVLEGPTFCVLWTRDGELRGPTVELGIVDSISRRALAGLASGLGYPVVEGRWRLEELERADEVMVCSAVRGVIAATAVGGIILPAPTPLADELATALDRLRRGA